LAKWALFQKQLRALWASVFENSLAVAESLDYWFASAPWRLCAFTFLRETTPSVRQIQSVGHDDAIDYDYRFAEHEHEHEDLFAGHPAILPRLIRRAFAAFWAFDALRRHFPGVTATSAGNRACADHEFSKRHGSPTDDT
jgi:hypothetical protein